MKLSKAELRYLRSLSQKKVRQTEQKFLVEGWRALKELLNAPAKVELVAVLPRYLDDPDYLKLLGAFEERGVPVKEIDEIQLKQAADTVHAQGAVALVQMKSFVLGDIALRRASLIVAADAISDPGNLGSIIRSADWFDADALLLGNGCVELHNEKVVRSTVGSIFHFPIVEGVDLPAACGELKKAGFAVVGLSGDGKVDYTDRKFSGKEVLVLGSEAHGISREMRDAADLVMRIPKYGRAESLNVGVACGIVLAHVRAQAHGRKGS